MTQPAPSSATPEHRDALLRAAALAGWAAPPRLPAGLSTAECDAISHAAATAVLDLLARWDAQASAERDLVRDILVALCERDGLPTTSSVVPGEPARNYELALRLRVGQVFGLAPFDVCHCGRPVHTYEDGFTRGMCESCSAARCDLTIGACPS